MTHYDCLGNKLSIGDKVIYFTIHRMAYHAVINSFTPIMVKIVYSDIDNQKCIATVLSTKSLLLNKRLNDND